MTEPDEARPWYAAELRPRDPAAVDREVTDAEGEILGRHFAWVAELHASGRVALSGRALSGDDPYGVVVFSASDEAEAQTLTMQMPGVAEGVFSATVSPFDLMLQGQATPGATYAYRLLPTRSDILLTGPTERETDLMMAHWGYCEQLHGAGSLVFGGRSDRPEDPWALIVLAGVDAAGAEEVMSAEPGVQGGLFTAKLFPFEIGA